MSHRKYEEMRCERPIAGRQPVKLSMPFRRLKCSRPHSREP